MKDGAVLLIETAAILNDEKSCMYFNNVSHVNTADHSPRIYNDPTTWWAPTVLCLKEMLACTLFEVEDASIKQITQNRKTGVGGVCLVAKAVKPEEVNPALKKNLSETYRNPGLSHTVFM